MSEGLTAVPGSRRGGARLAVGVVSSVFFLWLVRRGAELHGVWVALRSADLGEVAIAFSVLRQAIWLIPTTAVVGGIAIREVHRNTNRWRVPGDPPVPSPP